MKLFTRLVLVFAILLSTASAAIAREVKGTVVDTSDEPLIGVSVVPGSSKTGVSTDIDGNFAIVVPNGAVTLKFSYVGYSEKTVNVGAGENNIRVVLEESSTMLEETVVIGYGVQKKVNLTGAVASVDGAKFEDRTGGSVTNMLQGSVAGLNVSVTNGRPGTSGSLNIRGTTSINSAGPLVLIDGSVGEINDLNPNDIDNISVIKDASAAAVYGARAAFGVVLITTKSGQEKDGKATVRYSGRFGWTEPTTSTDYETRGYWHVYTVNEFFRAAQDTPYWKYDDYDMLQLLARVNDKTENPERPWVIESNRKGRNQYYYYGNYDWYHTLFRDNRPQQQHNISVSGGNKTVRYFLSGSFDRQEGMLKVIPDIYKKYNMRSKIDVNINKWVSLSNNTSFFGSTYDYQGRTDIDNTLGYVGRHALSCVPIVNPDGTHIRDTPYSDYAVGNSRHSEIIDGKHPNVDKKTDFTTTFRLNIKPIKQLTITGDFTYRFYQSRNQNRGNNVEFSTYPGEILVWDSGAGLNDLRESINTTNYYAVNAFATYKETFANDHNLTVMAGYNYERRNVVNRGMSAENLISEDLTDFNLVGVNENGDKISDVTGSQNQYALEGIFGRINYDYKGKYLLELSGRYDGTSRFGKGHRWGFFPSGSLGWRFTEESFMAPTRNWLSNGKVRLSYGELGNQNVSSYYTFLRLITSHTFDSFTFDGANKAAYTSLGAPIASDMTWETSKQWDLGLDLGFFNNRLNFTGDLYIRDTKDMLTDGIALPSVYGADPPQMNTADLRTKGYEAAISWNDNIQLFGQPFSYSIGFNISDYRSEITRYDNPTKSFVKDYYEGMRIGEIWGYRFDGLFQTTEEALEYASKVDLSDVTTTRNKGGWQAGDVKFVDLNGDNKISVGANTVDDPGDRTILGNSLASLQYGFNASFRYFGFDVSAFFQGTGNHYWYPTGQCMPFWGAYSYSYVSFLRSDFRDLIWSEDNPDAYFPRPMAYAATGGNLAQVNDRYLQNLRYLRFKNLTIGYTLPQKWTKKAYIEKLRVYFTGENLHYWSPLKKHTKWLDPESAYSRSGQNNNLAYTFPKTYMFGIDITF